MTNAFDHGYSVKVSRVLHIITSSVTPHCADIFQYKSKEDDIGLELPSYMYMLKDGRLFPGDAAC